ncbi:MAG TPA: peptide MFS transporter [Ignavibacteriaceae bacterium]|nr:peptide MFS transporter [Ignavibacteriaceae bacterium]
MFKGHPKGLYVAFFANMGERFGFYTMMAILVMFLQAKFNLPADKAGVIYSIFYFSIYALALLGGFLADRTQNYKGIIMIGIVVMFAGYILMAIPGLGLTIALIGLFTIAFGNGLFKGNLQALVGQMYDAPEYSKLRDTAFSIFYMGINVGAFFAPNAARGIRSWYLSTHGLKYDADLPSLCNQMLSGQLTDTTKLQELASTVSSAPITDLKIWAQNYIDVFSTGYNYAFGIAAIAMLISLAAYVFFKGYLPDRKKLAATSDSKVQTMTKEEEKSRLTALGLVFLVVIFFWMSFHQNGLTLTYFARDYTVKAVDALTNNFFNLWSFLSILAVIYGLVFLIGKKSSGVTKAIGGFLVLASAYLVYYFNSTFTAANPIEPEIFQQFNPIFIVVLTPVVVKLFAMLREKNIEPSTPRKIGIGMILAAVGFVIMILGSLNIMDPYELNGEPSPDRVSANWLIGTYFILTVAELFLSPMGLSFVSKVAPPRFQGLMQGGWLGATALGNQLLFVGSSLWVAIAVWQVWAVFVVCCLLSAAFIFSIMKKLEKATS